MRKPKLAILIFDLLTSVTAMGQTNFSKYFKESLFPSVDNSSYPAVKFTWNMAGKIQAPMNNGLAELDEDNPDVAIHNFDGYTSAAKFLPGIFITAGYVIKCWDILHMPKKIFSQHSL
jgi:hypothetical protein